MKDSKNYTAKKFSTFLNILFVTLVSFLGLIVFPAVSVIEPINHVASVVSSKVFVSWAIPSANSFATATSTLHLMVVDTEAEREQGLSDTPSLATTAGMWFVFQTPAQQGIWMKDMNYPLDIVWLDADMKIQYIVKDALPSSYPQTIYYPSVLSSYVLEVNEGYADAHGFKVGDILTNDVNLAYSQKM